MAKAPRDCPCFSGERTAACCGPLHRGEREAASPEQLMRSRYGAFALGLGEYLVRTLAADHPDRALPHAAFVQELSRAHERQRFLGLRILHAAQQDDSGEVLFHARVFEKGADRSFAELSQFVREGDAWRYASGIVVPTAELPADIARLTPEEVRRSAGFRDAQ
ncbi:MAG TPA: YchJ family metal-binding protein [Labilithrix sp.]|nr:YchJ family metal-binding protein [Labilithrix sp.]